MGNEHDGMHAAAALIEATGVSLDGELRHVGAVLRRALANSNMVSVCGNRASGALVTGAGFDYEVFLPPGQAGDIILAVLPEEPSEDLVNVIMAARARGLVVVALLPAESLALAHGADHVLRMPNSDSRMATLAMFVVLHTLHAMLYPAAEASV